MERYPAVFFFVARHGSTPTFNNASVVLLNPGIVMFLDWDKAGC